MTVAADGFASTGEALGVVQSAMGYLAGADYAGMPGEVQAEVLRVMERVDAVQAAVRGRAVSAFAAALTYHEYAVRGMPRWFVTQTRVTKAAGSAHKAWARRADEHPGVIDAMIEGVLSESWARAVCAWTGRLPEDWTPPQDHPRLHFDLHAADAVEQEAEAARLVSLGARRVDWDSYPEDPDFIVLEDPDGNRFCIVDLSHEPA